MKKHLRDLAREARRHGVDLTYQFGGSTVRAVIRKGERTGVIRVACTPSDRQASTAMCRDLRRLIAGWEAPPLV